jgi:hypothetical protein
LLAARVEYTVNISTMLHPKGILAFLGMICHKKLNVIMLL